PITIIGILSLSPPFLFLGGFSDARSGVAVVEVESRWSRWSRGGRSGVASRSGQQIWRLAVGYFA
ncbi:hypothetical protein FCV25MIE_16969, partial [Fagus crenata]